MEDTFVAHMQELKLECWFSNDSAICFYHHVVLLKKKSMQNLEQTLKT